MKENITKNFEDAHPPLDKRSSIIEAQRCYYCYDAPCIKACPTSINIPKFISQISTNNLEGAAETILSTNIMGGMCARACPTENLCEGDCVRNTDDGNAVKIGLLQRVATDHALDKNIQFFKSEKSTSKRVAIVGAGPSGLACAHELAKLGHYIDIFEKKEKPAGLNEYGIAAYKTVDDFAQREVEYILAIGSITIKTNQTLFKDFSLESLTKKYDAVYLAIGLGLSSKLNFKSYESKDFDKISGLHYAVDYIEKIRQTKDLTKLSVPFRVGVIGGGMTAIDIACQVSKLGAKQVDILYRGDKAKMSASYKEVEFAANCGVNFRYNTIVNDLIINDKKSITGVEIVDTSLKDRDGNFSKLELDALFIAIGQKFEVHDELANIIHKANLRLEVDDSMKTSMAKVFAGGDCRENGFDLIVSAVEDGKTAANSIDQFLTKTK